MFPRITFSRVLAAPLWMRRVLAILLRSRQYTRPGWHWLARYPVLLIQTGVLLLIAWGVFLADFDGFHIIWHENVWQGTVAGIALALLLAFFWFTTYLLDRARNERNSRMFKFRPRRIRWRPYVYWWLATLGLFLIPAVTKNQMFFGEPWESDDGAGARVYFPVGVLGFAIVFSAALYKTSGRDRPKLVRRLGWGSFLVLAAAYLALSTFHVFAISGFCPFYSTAVNCLLCLGFATAVYGAILWFAARWRWADRLIYPTLIVLAIACVPGVNENEHRLPCMTITDDEGACRTYYDRPTNLFLVGSEPSASDREWKRDRHRAEDTIRHPLETDLISTSEMLTNWQERITRLDGFFPKQNQPAVVVTVSGGASTSALFSACMLFNLEEAYPGIGERIVLISGASGGMLGTAYYAAQCLPGGIISQLREKQLAYVRGVANRETYVNEVAQLREKFLAGFKRDFLTPLIQKWIFKDIPYNFFQSHTDNDRGRALEAAWSRSFKGAPDAKTGSWFEDRSPFDIPVASFRQWERKALIPSLVFSPMIVEDGRQLLISNLDLDALVEAEAKPEPYPALAAVEFFKLFPKAKEFRLGTAVRLNASFPFLSPAATLPTNPPRRVVDAGYYDNYGANVALKWIEANETDLRRVTDGKGVILLQLFTYGYETNVDLWTSVAEDDQYREHEGFIRAKGGLHSATTPLEGLFSSWRANMVYRVEDRIGYIEKWLNRFDPSPVWWRPIQPFFVRVRIPGPDDPPMNWYLRSDVIDDIENHYGDALKTMAILKSSTSTPDERVTALNNPKAQKAFPGLKNTVVAREDVEHPKTAKLNDVYKSRPIFNESTDLLLMKLPPANGPIGKEK